MSRARLPLVQLLALTLALLVAGAPPAGATILIHESLEDLVTTHGTILVGEVLEAHSYWNPEGSFILTDVLISADRILKGDTGDRELTITIMGGTVGDLTTLILGGAELVPGSDYLLFLDRQDLPGAQGVLTVRDHAQGIFDLRPSGDGLRAVSQAVHQTLLPDAAGVTVPPGGVEGLPLEIMIREIGDLSLRPQENGRKVKR